MLIVSCMRTFKGCQYPLFCLRVGNRGGGEGPNRCGLVLCMGEIYHTVGDSRNILLDACGAHSLPGQGVHLN